MLSIRTALSNYTLSVAVFSYVWRSIKGPSMPDLFCTFDVLLMYFCTFGTQHQPEAMYFASGFYVLWKVQIGPQYFMKISCVF